MAHIFATINPHISEREVKNMNRSRQIATEGMVLLENNGTLPLKNIKNIALYGNGARYTVKGGTGSGGVNSRFEANVEEGMEAAGVIVTTKAWLTRYDEILKSARLKYYQWLKAAIEKDGGEVVTMAFDNPFKEPDITPVTDEDIRLSETDTAIYVLSRNSGEGKDRSLDSGDYYLTDTEQAAIQKVATGYKNVIVVLNVGGVIDTRFLRSVEGIGAVVLMSQPGNMAGHALMDILLGNVTPSGHLTSTWADQYMDYPSADSFSYINGNLDDEYYKEGIYVGYRYFDTFNVTPAYPFGYGLSYTDFSIKPESIVADAGEVRLSVKVTNTGAEFSGKEVVQVYYSAPKGCLEKPYQELAAYAKTKELAPGESEVLDISFEITSMASFDASMAAYIMEAGDYILRVGNSSRNTFVAAVLNLDAPVATEILSNRFELDCQMEQLSASGVTSQGTDLPEGIVRIQLSAEEFITEVADYREENKAVTCTLSESITLDDVKNGKASLDELVGQLSIEDLADLCVGTARKGSGESAVVGSSSMMCPGAAGDTFPKPNRNIGSLIMADGPAGLRLSRTFAADSDGNIIVGSAESAMSDLIPLMKLMSDEEAVVIPEDAEYHYQYCTALPIATMLAQTWNVELIAEAGDIVGEEMEEFGINLWLAPGMNIHRNPLCGRNFEYYSEDPLISGMCAAAATTGVQKHKGCGTTIKHFAFNNQEDNRMHTNAHIGERAIREIYLKGFEIAIKKSQPMSVMSSYNLINGVHTANSYDLITAITRDEWGYEGIVMTDWSATGNEGVDSGGPFKYGYSSSAGCIKAGNDLIMPGNEKDFMGIVEAVGKEITLGDLQACAKRMIKVVMKNT